MKLKFNNLGVIKEAEFEIGKLTVIAGKNNTGKTYLSYATWGGLQTDFYSKQIRSLFLKYVKDNGVLQKLRENQLVELDLGDFKESILSSELINIYKVLVTKSDLIKIFSSPEDKFSDSIGYIQINDINLNDKTVLIRAIGGLNAISTASYAENHVEIHINNSVLKDVDTEMFDDLIIIQTKPLLDFSQTTFLLTTQRDNISLFYKDIDRSRSAALKEMQHMRNYDLLDKGISRFPLPVEKNIDFARDLTTQVIKTDSFLVKEHPELLQEIEEMLGVRYEVSNDAVLVRDAQTQAYIPDYMASTSVRSLMYLHFWLKHQAQKGDLLMIDEPELSLHPENQIKLARLFVKLVNVGVKVWITTHSDYIIKELNNCLMLAGELEDKAQLMKQLGYKTDEILQHDDLRYYTAFHDPNLGGCTLRRETVGKYGVENSSFDDTLDQLVNVSYKVQNAVL